MGSRKKFSVICGLFVANSCLVYQYAQDRFALPAWLDDMAQRAKGAVITAIDLLAIKPTPAKLVLTMPANQLAPAIHKELLSIGATCLDKRKATQSKQISTWKDSQGVLHIFEKHRQIDDGTPVTLVSNIPAEALSVNFLGLQGSYKLKQGIISSVNSSKTLFEQVVPAEFVKPLVNSTQKCTTC